MRVLIFIKSTAFVLLCFCMLDSENYIKKYKSKQKRCSGSMADAFPLPLTCYEGSALAKRIKRDDYICRTQPNNGA